MRFWNWLKHIELMHPKTRLASSESLRSPPKFMPLNLNRKEKIKIAIDESIGAALAKKIEGRGYNIVTRAGHAETDESWMKRALQSGAVFIISPDLDIPSMIERENLPMVWIDFLFAGHVNPKLNAEMPKEQKHAIWSQYLHDRIQAKIKLINRLVEGVNEKSNSSSPSEGPALLGNLGVRGK